MSEMAKLGQEFGEYVVQLTAELVGGKQPRSMSEMERGTREMLQGMFNDANHIGKVSAAVLG